MSLSVLVTKVGKELYIIAGTLGTQGQPLKGKVTIPASTWKIVVVLEPGSGINGITTKTRAIAVGNFHHKATTKVRSHSQLFLA